MTLRQDELDALWDFSDPTASETRLRQAAEGSAQGSADANELLTQVARALGLQGRFGEAHALLDSLPDEGPRVPLERGRLHNSAGDPAAAIPLFEIAAERATGFLAVDALHMLAIADAERAEQHTRSALELVEASDDERTKRWATSLHNNYGWALHDAGDLKAALTEFESAKDAAVTDDQKHMAQWTIAHTLRLLGRANEARAILQSLDQSDPYVGEELDALGAD